MSGSSHRGRLACRWPPQCRAGAAGTRRPRRRCGIVTLEATPDARSRALSAAGGNRPVLQHGFGAADYVRRCHAHSRSGLPSRTTARPTRPARQAGPTTPPPDVNVGPNTACGEKGRERPWKTRKRDTVTEAGVRVFARSASVRCRGSSPKGLRRRAQGCRGSGYLEFGDCRLSLRESSVGKAPLSRSERRQWTSKPQRGFAGRPATQRLRRRGGEQSPSPRGSRSRGQPRAVL